MEINSFFHKSNMWGVIMISLNYPFQPMAFLRHMLSGRDGSKSEIPSKDFTSGIGTKSSPNECSVWPQYIEIEAR